MKIKAYSFEQNSHTLAQVKVSVAEAIDNGTVYFDSYSDPKLLFAEIGGAIDDADVILIGVESKAYLKFKPILIKAFNFTPAYSEKIENAVGVQQDNRPGKETGVIDNDEQLRQENEGVEGQSEVESVEEITEREENNNERINCKRLT